jgi:hypothetical protein
MAITNYSELKVVVNAWSHRNDVGTMIDDFIALAESDMYNNDIVNLDVVGMETIDTGTLSISSKFVNLPADYISMRDFRLTIANEDGWIFYKAPTSLIKSDIVGRPYFYTIVGSQIEFDRTPDQAYTITFEYKAKPAAITSSNTTNAILTSYPNIYLYGVLAQVFLYTQDTESESRYLTKFYKAIKGANKAAKKARFPVAPQMTIDTPTP